MGPQACPLRRRAPPLADDLLQHLGSLPTPAKQELAPRQLGLSMFGGGALRAEGLATLQRDFLVLASVLHAFLWPPAAPASIFFFRAKITLANAFSSLPFSFCPLHVVPPPLLVQTLLSGLKLD